MKKTICWITSGYFLQVDLPLLNQLNKHFNIKWFVYAPAMSDMALHAQEYARNNKIDIEILSNNCHRYNPIIYFNFCKHVKKIRKINADIYYFDITAFPYLFFAIKKYLSPEKVIMAMHHGTVPTLMDFKYLYGLYLKYLYKQPFTYQYFSQSQASYFKGDITKRYVINLSLNNYGNSTEIPPSDYVSFLYFGVIIGTKKVDSIIKAACLVKERTSKKFKVKIVGYCRNWEPYQELIKYPEIFELNIERVPDERIPDLFSTAHYLLQPYTFVSQSGPLRMAYGYNLPVIVSDLDGFKEHVIDNITGKFCKVNDVESLAQVMLDVIDNHPNMYNSLKKNQQDFVDKNLSQDFIISKYLEMFNQVIERQK